MTGGAVERVVVKRTGFECLSHHLLAVALGKSPPSLRLCLPPSEWGVWHHLPEVSEAGWAEHTRIT